MSGENDKNENLLIDTFIKGFEETKSITKNLQAENQSNAIALNSLRAELNIVHQNTDWLVKAVRDEGGDRSVMARLITFENQLELLVQWMEEQKREKELKIKTLDTLANEDHRGKWQLRIALATGCLGFIATIITTILSFYFKK